jgi:hypothetical protein
LYFSNIFSQNDPTEGFYNLVADNANIRIDSKKFHRLLKKNKQDLGICCFTDSRNNSPFWGNYANAAGGFCIEFNTDKLLGNLPEENALVRILYCETVPEIRVTSDFPDKTSARKIISCKHRSWQHESEWRMIKNGIGIQSFKAFDCIRSIQVGRYTNQTLKRRLMDFAREKGVAIFQMYIRGYEIRSRPISHR